MELACLPADDVLSSVRANQRFADQRTHWHLPLAYRPGPAVSRVCSISVRRNLGAAARRLHFSARTVACWLLRTVLLGRQHPMRSVVLHSDHPGASLNLEPGVDMGSVAVDPAGNRIATRNFQTGEVKLWQAQTGKLERSISKWGHGPIYFSPDGKLLAAGADESHVFSTSDREEKGQFSGNVRFAPDKETLVASIGNYTIRIHDIESGKELARLEDPALCLTPYFLLTSDGSGLITVDKDKAAHIWDLRLLRRQLADRGLDWSAPPIQPRTGRTGGADSVEMGTTLNGRSVQTANLTGLSAGLAGGALVPGPFHQAPDASRRPRVGEGRRPGAPVHGCVQFTAWFMQPPRKAARSFAERDAGNGP